MSVPQRLVGLGLSLLVLVAGTAVSGGEKSTSRGRGGSAALGSRGGISLMPAAAVGGGWGWAPGGYVSYSAVGTPFGIYTYGPPMIFPGAGGFGWGAGGFGPPIRIAIDPGPLAPAPPRDLVAPPIPAPQAPKPTTHKDAARAAQLVVLGDRLFRVNNLKRAEDRYLQAARLDPSSAAVQVRLAQVALVREHYAEAARRLRDAETAEPGWITRAPDVQSLYGEPREFARHLALLETHLQAHPEDRDAWLVLGAQWYLSGRTARAADVFLRLDDPRRKPDIALAAFLVATNQD